MANSMFSKRHYEAVAEVLKEINYDARAYDGVEMWEKIRSDLSALFESDNEKFNRTKFEEACER